jgi:hypothetical protein
MVIVAAASLLSGAGRAFAAGRRKYIRVASRAASVRRDARRKGTPSATQRDGNDGSADGVWRSRRPG